MYTRWKNLYPGENGGLRIGSDNPADIYQLVESLLETIGDCESRITRMGALDALAIAESVLSSLEDHGEENGMFNDGDSQDIDTDSLTTDRSSREFRL